MTDHRSRWLSGIAALALVAGTGLASAQQTPTDQGIQGNKPQAMKQTNKAPSAGNKMGQGSQGAAHGQMSQINQKTNQQKFGQANRGAGENKANQRAEQQGGATGKRAETNNRANKGMAGEHHAARNAHEYRKGATQARYRSATGKTAQQRYHYGQPGAARQGINASQAQGAPNINQGRSAQRERNGLEGLQGKATGLNRPLNDQQRTSIREAVIHAPGAPRVGNVDFDVTVGTVIPHGRIHVVPVPQTLVSIDPAWRGFRYFVYEDEIIIVNPRTMRIVAVVPA
jgi:Protein of unknown function (DUF1236)